MNICVLGWYGTETLGDRSILLGLSLIFEKTFGKCKLYLGSIYPFFSKRCYIEDENFYKIVAPEVDIEIFSVTERIELESAIQKCSLVVMGGGPIMDLYELGIIEYGVGYAKRNGKKTALLGCGIGPLFQKKFRKISAHLINIADTVVLRDRLSKEIAELLLSEYRFSARIINVLFDPAIIPILYFKMASHLKKRGVLAINLREFPICCNKNGETIDDSMFISLLKYAAISFDKVKLIPQHTFFVGGDDRYYMSLIAQRTAVRGVEVVHNPLSLYKLFEEYYSADCCIGMRYHSVLFQTVLNGKNGILDYTEPNIGKISGFLDVFNLVSAYEKRYVNIQETIPDPEALISDLRDHSATHIDDSIITDTVKGYDRILSELII